MKIDGAREQALKILYKIYEDKAYSNKALSSALIENKELTDVDKGFITELVYGTLKYTLTFDYIISLYSSVKKNKLSKWTMIILRTGLYQIFFMDRVPDFAICNECVKLSGKYGHEGTKRFVNGVLRNIIRSTKRNIDNVEFPSLAEKYGLSQWMAKAFIDDFGSEFTEDMMRSSMSPAKVSLRANTLKISRENLIGVLKREGFSAYKSDISEYGILLEKGLAITENRTFKEGFFYIQGESSMLAAEVLGPRADDNILDLCAAPGGKSTHIAEIMGNKGNIEACDIYDNKLKLIEESSKRLGISIITTVNRDASIFDTKLSGKFDRVLADVPCSGLGILKSRPEIKFNRTKEETDLIPELQYKILLNAAKYVRPGGTLVYSTCTVLKKENIFQIERFMSENKEDFILDGEPMTLFPNTHNTDGFFIAKLIRRN